MCRQTIRDIVAWLDSQELAVDVEIPVIIWFIEWHVEMVIIYEVK
jgi:hypothetical protein